MKIRAGYEISYDCPQPTPMILQVSVHPSRQADLISWDGLQIDPQQCLTSTRPTFRVRRRPRAVLEETTPVDETEAW